MSVSARSRENMVVGQLITNKVLDAALLSAVAEVPREAFVTETLRGVAYVDEDIELAPGRFLLEPLVLTRLLQLAKIGTGDLVLDIGCATGYSTAIIARLASQVTGVEADREFVETGRKLLRKLGIKNAEIVNGGHAAGYAASQPYDVVLVNGAVQRDVSPLAEQLKDGGRIVFVKNVAARPGGLVGLGRATVGIKTPAGIAYKEYFDASIPVLPGLEAVAGFNF